jgi:hypothetical protein
MEGICIGFAPGNSSLEEMALGTVARRIQEVPPLADPADPCGFHALPVPAEIST